MHEQRYISNELTHFVGRAYEREDGTFDREKQYECFIKILREGRLLHRQDAPNGPARPTFLGSGSFVERTMIAVDAVCFCDIPVSDFAIHMDKYGPFGLSFLKSFLVERGANPVFYIAANSIVSPDDPEAEIVFRGAHRPEPLTRGGLMEQLIREYGVTELRSLSMAFDERRRPTIAAAGVDLARGSVLNGMIHRHFLSFCVPFDSTKTDDYKKNYYMEREWRVVGDVGFDLYDFFRVILPKEFAKRFRADVKDYLGQITFATPTVATG
jgi:hypothetical protein